LGNGKMKRQMAMRVAPERVSQRLVAPAMFLGSLVGIALMLYAVDTISLRALLP
jgi:hypothetical protein